MAIENRGLLPSRTRAGTSNWPPVFLWVPGLLVAAAMALPLAYLVLRTLGTGGDAWDLLFRMRVLETLGRTVFLALAVTGACIAIAVPLAWITVRTDLPFRRVWSVLTILPLVIPSYVGGFVVVAALGPKGMLQGFLAGPLGVERLPEIYGLPGATLTLALLSYPYVLLSVRAGLWGLDPALEEASRSLGYSRRVTFFRVVLPQLKPAIAAGALLVALYTLSDFGAVSLLRYEVFTYVIYLQYDVGARTLAAASSLVLVVLALGILAFEGRTRSRSPYYRSTVGAVRPQTAVRLGRWRWPAFAFCGLVVTLSMVMPIAILGYWLGRGVMAGQSLGLEWSTIANSMYVSVLAALAAVLAAIPLAVLTVRYAGRISALLERITYVRVCRCRVSSSPWRSCTSGRTTRCRCIRTWSFLSLPMWYYICPRQLEQSDLPSSRSAREWRRPPAVLEKHRIRSLGPSPCPLCGPGFWLEGRWYFSSR